MTDHTWTFLNIHHGQHPVIHYTRRCRECGVAMDTCTITGFVGVYWSHYLWEARAVAGCVRAAFHAVAVDFRQKREKRR